MSKKDDFTDDRQSSSHSDAPKILLKSKEKPVAPASIQPPPPISIATRESVASPTPNKTVQSHPATNATVKDLVAPVIIEQSVSQIRMTKPMSLVNDHFLLSTAPFDYLVDNNPNFFVVGVIGPQATGKSTLMNLLCPTDTTGRQIQFFRNQDAAFATKRTTVEPTTDGIHMYVTKDRTILLDCAPVLCNPYKKDYVLNEIDDLKMVIFMMSVCHLLIVVQEDMMNGGMLRLLHCAELMKPSLDKDATTISSGLQQNEEYLPNVLFVKNMANTRDFQSVNVERINRMYKFFFSRSKLRMYAGNHRPADDIIEDANADGARRPAIQRNINFIVFPTIPNGNLLF